LARSWQETGELRLRRSRLQGIMAALLIGRLVARLKANEQRLVDARHNGMPSALEAIPIPADPVWLHRPTDRTSASFATRLVFSALVDADFLCT